MKQEVKAAAIIADIIQNHLPRVQEGMAKGYPDENQILVMYDHAVRARLLKEIGDEFEKQVCRADHDETSVGELYYHTDAHHLIDWVYDWVMKAFAEALKVESWDRYESDGGMDEALSYEVNQIIERSKESLTP